MADDVDITTQQQEQEMRMALAQRASTRMEDPDEDEEGNRYCLDCADIIPPERVQAVGAVRCVHCAGKRERYDRLAKQPGIRRYLNTRDDEQE
ncbi:TraR/DksA C4-type zinc finger protein [Candidatus Igneacidithiobacillus taiwanensis]|uniref:TraR/DksA C4-type zinc finger protein n=1 Tax=Candidatus Igneacidithiobacillus taiwanensis TaxID=1945924 RepID=UPI00289D6348|nr:TraR/DksA C4-type zinc finger protein [Candidatus Igneacidithiobacillus taiwanensis]